MSHMKQNHDSFNLDDLINSFCTHFFLVSTPIVILFLNPYVPSEINDFPPITINVK